MEIIKQNKNEMEVKLSDGTRVTITDDSKFGGYVSINDFRKADTRETLKGETVNSVSVSTNNRYGISKVIAHMSGLDEELVKTDSLTFNVGGKEKTAKELDAGLFDLSLVY